MSTSAEYDFAGHDDRILLRYDHAREKHPYFCDMITCLSESGADTHLGLARGLLAAEIDTGNVEVGDVLECEFYEAMQAYTHGDTSHAVEELYDCVAVCLRTIDVLEGRQKLGKPKEALPPCTCGGEAATIERGTEPEGFAIMCSRCFRKTALHPTLALAEEEWRTMLTKNNTTTKENNK